MSEQAKSTQASITINDAKTLDVIVKLNQEVIDLQQRLAQAEQERDAANKELADYSRRIEQISMDTARDLAAESIMKLERELVAARGEVAAIRQHHCDKNCGEETHSPTCEGLSQLLREQLSAKEGE